MSEPIQIYFPFTNTQFDILLKAEQKFKLHAKKIFPLKTYTAQAVRPIFLSEEDVKLKDLEEEKSKI